MAKAKAASNAVPQPTLYIGSLESCMATPEIPIFWRPIRCAKHHFDKEICKCEAGPQWRALLTPAREILFGGARGGSKSETGRAWLIAGNPLVAEKDCKPVDVSYANHPRYRALVLRKNVIDLQDWLDRAREFYQPFGARITEKPPVIEFPSGAKIVLGHLAEEDAYEKYQGQEFHRILIEELTQIPSELLYKRVLASCRSTFWDERRGIKELRPQIFITTNPGGPGSGWVKKRFISARKPNGQQVKPNEEWKTEGGLSRIYIPARVTDNPYLSQDYVANLQDLPEPQRRAWLDGDWDALAGAYFTDFRPAGRLTGDPVNANHVVKAETTELKPWWPRLIGVDWGFGHYAVALWGCQHPNGQLHIYRELAVSNVGSEELFAEIARRSVADLRGLEQPHMTLWLSPDAFGKKDDTNTIAQQAAKGIDNVLGPDSVFLLSETEEEMKAERFIASREWQMRKASIVIRRAQHQRVFGWNYMRTLMNFRQPVQVATAYRDEEFIRIAHDEGADVAFAYRAMFTPKIEVRPKFIIHDCCQGLIAAIPEAIYDEGTEDVLKTDQPSDDYIDAARYLTMGHRYTTEREPKSEFVANRVATVGQRYPEGLGERIFDVAAQAEKDYEHADGTVQPFVWRSLRNRLAGLTRRG